MTNFKHGITYFTKIKSKKVKWLWYPYIPYGKITLIEGDPGEGKTSVILNLIATMSTGGCLPLTSTHINGISIYQNDEDDISDTIKPRLEKQKADCNKICFIDNKEQPLFIDDDIVEKSIKQTGAKLLVFDPIQSFIGNKVDMNNANSIRPVLRRLKQTAERTGCAIILIRHLSKSSNKKALYRGLGSIDITAAARSVLYIGRDHHKANTGYMIQQKNNLAPFGNSIEFKIDDNQITWIGETEIKINDILNDTGNFKHTKLEDAKLLLKQQLSQGPMCAKKLYLIAEANNISKRTLLYAKSELPINSIKTKDGWTWEYKEKRGNNE